MVTQPVVKVSRESIIIVSFMVFMVLFVRVIFLLNDNNEQHFVALLLS